MEIHGFSEKNTPPTLPTLEEKEKAAEQLEQAFSKPDSNSLTSEDRRDLEKRFNFHPANTQETKDKHEATRRWSLEHAVLIYKILPKCRERSLAITALEEAMFWVNAGIARSNAD